MGLANCFARGVWEGGGGREGHACGAPRLGSAPLLRGLLQGAACPGEPGSAGTGALADAALAAGPIACAASVVVAGTPASMTIDEITAASSNILGRAASTAEKSLASERNEPF